MTWTYLSLVSHLVLCTELNKYIWLCFCILQTWMRFAYWPSKHHWDKLVWLHEQCCGPYSGGWMNSNNVCAGVPYSPQPPVVDSCNLFIFNKMRSSCRGFLGSRPLVTAWGKSLSLSLSSEQPTHARLFSFISRDCRCRLSLIILLQCIICTGGCWVGLAHPAVSKQSTFGSFALHLWLHIYLEPRTS